MRIFTQIMGTLRVIFCFLWMGLGVLGLVYGLRGLDWAEDALERNISGVTANIEVINNLLTEMIDVVDRVDASLSTVERSMIDASFILDDSRPLIDVASRVVAQDLPQALDDVQQSMPAVIEAAATIDQTLSLLSKFKFSLPNPFGADWEFSLGVDYEPPVPLEESLVSLSANLEGIPDTMRSVEGDLVTADLNLAVMGDNLFDIAYDMDLMRAQIADINPEIEAMISNLGEVQSSLAATQDGYPRILGTTRKVFVGVMVLFILTQIPTAYFGFLKTRDQGQEFPPIMEVANQDPQPVKDD
jgi:phage-related protein